MKPKNILLFVIFTYFIINCAPFKEKIMKGPGSKEVAMQNAITDFYYTYSDIDEYTLFYLWECDKYIENPDIYCFKFFRAGNDMKFYIDSLDVVGRISSYLPDSYKEYRGKLFLIDNNEEVLNTEIIEVLNRYGVLDSTKVKVQLGLLPVEQYPVVRIEGGHAEKGVYYFVCKDNIAKYKKLKTSIFFQSPKDFPRVRCN